MHSEYIKIFSNPRANCAYMICEYTITFSGLRHFLYPELNPFICQYERCLEKDMATHSSILVWRIPWTEEPGGLQSMESQRVGLTLTRGRC